MCVPDKWCEVYSFVSFFMLLYIECCFCLWWYDGLVVTGWWHCKLSLWQPTLPLVTTKFASRGHSVLNMCTCLCVISGDVCTDILQIHFVVIRFSCTMIFLHSTKLSFPSPEPVFIVYIFPLPAWNSTLFRYFAILLSERSNMTQKGYYWYMFL